MKKLLIASFGIFFLSACAIYGRTFDTKSNGSLISNQLKIVVNRISTGTYNTNYFIDIRIKNNSTKNILFDSGDLSVKKLSNEISYFSISKDKDSVTVPVGSGNILTRINLEPGQATEGRIWISTQNGEADGSPIELHFKGATLKYE